MSVWQCGGNNLLALTRSPFSKSSRYGRASVSVARARRICFESKIQQKQASSAPGQPRRGRGRPGGAATTGSGSLHFYFVILRHTEHVFSRKRHRDGGMTFGAGSLSSKRDRRFTRRARRNGDMETWGQCVRLQVTVLARRGFCKPCQKYYNDNKGLEWRSTKSDHPRPTPSNERDTGSERKA